MLNNWCYLKRLRHAIKGVEDAPQDTALHVLQYCQIFDVGWKGSNCGVIPGFRQTLVLSVGWAGLTGVLPGHEVLPQGGTPAGKGGEASLVEIHPGLVPLSCSSGEGPTMRSNTGLDNTSAARAWPRVEK